MRYLVMIERSATGFNAYIEDLPGCVATGATLDETRRLIQEAKFLHLEGMREDGDPVPEPTVYGEMLEPIPLRDRREVAVAS